MGETENTTQTGRHSGGQMGEKEEKDEFTPA